MNEIGEGERVYDSPLAVRGNGARYNEGKPPLDLVPVRVWMRARSANTEMPFEDLLGVMAFFQDVQEGRRPRLALTAHQIELAVRVFAYGERKYSRLNWQCGMPWSSTFASALRHYRALMEGETTDPESGEPHLGHIYCNAIMLDWYIEHYAEGNDMVPTPAVVGVASQC